MPTNISIPELLAEYETRLLKDKLLEFPQALHYAKQELYEARKVLTDAQTARAEAEAMLQVMIAAETNPNTGKAAYSNAEARAAELTTRKKNDVEYQGSDLAVRSAEGIVNNLQFNLERLQDEFRAYRYVVDLTARELALMTSDCLAGDGNGNGNGVGNGNRPQPY